MKRVFYTLYASFMVLLFVSIGTQVVAQDLVHLRITTPDGAIDWDIDATKTANDHGPQLPESISGEIVKAFDGVTEPSDNDTWTEFGQYCCDPTIVNADEVAGKIAYISRGACIFSGKILNAQNAGAIAVIIANRAPFGLDAGTHTQGLITMAGTAPESDSITIPAIFISYEDRIEIEKLMELGPVMGTFEASTLYDAAGPMAYSTPLDQVQPFNPKVIAYTRTTDTLFNVDFRVDITDPSGNTTTLTEPVDTLLPGKDWNAGVIHEPIIEFGEYTPTELGAYTMTFTAQTAEGTWPIDDAEISQSFEVTEYTYAIDNGNPGDLDGRQVNEVSYLENTGIYNMGAFYRTGANGGTATHVSFAVANPGALDIGNGFDFTINLYNADMDGDGFPDAELPAEPIASTVYSLDGSEVPNELMHAAFPSPVTLDANGTYLAMVVSGGFAFTDQIPAYTTAGGTVYPTTSCAMQFGTIYRPASLEWWNGGGTAGDATNTYPYGGRSPMIRMQMEGFVPPVSVDLLPEGQVNIFPTLTKDMVNIQFELAQNTPDVKMIVVSADGQMMLAQEYNNVMNETIELNVQNYPAGNYFVTIKTDQGVRTKKFVVVR